MIFKRFFAPSHTSKDPQTRIAAIAKLSADKAQDKAVLHELAFNDSSAEVTLAALQKLNSFALWQKAAQTSGHEKVRRNASRQIEQAVLNPEDKRLSVRERQDYLSESANTELVRAALMQPDVNLDTLLTVTLLDKLNREEFMLEFYARIASQEVRQQLIDREQSPALLDKLRKRESDDTLVGRIDDKVQALADAATRPAAVSKALTLVLAKIKALLDKADYADVNQRFSALQQDYQELEPDFVWLEDEAVEQARQKYATLTGQVERHLARLKPQWEARQREQQVSQTRREANVAQQIAQKTVSALYAHDLVQVNADQLAQANKTLEDFDEAITELKKLTASDLTDIPREVSASQKALAGLQEKIAGFSAQQQLIISLKALVEEAEQSGQSEEGADVAGLTAQYKAIEDKLFVMPQALKARWQEFLTQARQARQSKVSADDKALKDCRRQINIIENMISQGKFRGAMSRFSQLQNTYASLDDSQQRQVKRKFDNTLHTIERLEGWQSYLAAPRKPELLEQARTLAQTAPDNISQRADSIKDLRQQWQTLTAPSDDSAMNQAFDEALEAAFAPCRAFYAQQEQRREQTRQLRMSLIEQAAGLELSDSPDVLVRKVEALKNQWRDAGNLEKSEYESLKTQWEAALVPAREVISDWQQQNREQKQALVEQAQALADSDDKQGASSQAQALQQQWKAIGHAGRRHESKLWQAFRAANDQLFDALKANRETQLNEQSALADEVISQINTVRQTLNTADTQQIAVALESVHQQFGQLNGQAGAKARRHLQQLESDIARLHSRQRQAQQQDAYHALLMALTQWTDPQSSAQAQIDSAVWAKLKRQHQNGFKATASAERDRQWYTTKLELLADLPTPSDWQSQRQDIQLAMMMARLESGEQDSLDDVVAAWLSAGPLTAEEQELLQRFTAVINHLFPRLDDNASEEAEHESAY
ncbi:DUF349 domain-containing protein [Salinimonas lutimaris]|uniref:DUF349 domain-containing protein n=1 Tax=Salinimonas lutimaris TaxID=914153 RepID=UPI0010C12306|nr:DUF349 domain-containing protein [Salinimonas lutimaris]